MTQSTPLVRGLLAAAFTPLERDGAVDRAAIPQMVDGRVKHGISGLYVLGSTGERPSLPHDERCAVAEAIRQHGQPVP